MFFFFLSEVLLNKEIDLSNKIKNNKHTHTH